MKRQNYSGFLTLAMSLVGLAVPLHGQFEFVYAGSFDPGNVVYGYNVNFNTGAPTLIPGSFAGGLSITSIAASPGGQFLYMVAPPDFQQSTKSILAFTIDPASGVLAPVAGSPYAANFVPGPAAIAIHPSGRFAYVADTGNILMSVYSINSSTGALTLLQQLAGKAGVINNPILTIGLTIDPTGRFVYAADGLGSVFGFAIDPNAGTLTPVPGSPFAQPPVETPEVVLIHPSGRFAYIIEAPNLNPNFAGGAYEVAGYAIDPNTGALTTPVPVSPAVVGGLSAYSAAMDPYGKFLYVPTGNPNITSFSIDASTGSLTPLAPTNLTPLSVYTGGVEGSGYGSPGSLALDCTGRFLYARVGWFGTGGPVPGVDSFVLSLSVDRQTGALTQGTPAPSQTPPSFGVLGVACTPGPHSLVTSLPALTNTLSFQVQWSGTDIGGPGIASYTIYVSDNGGPFTAWLTQTASTQAIYSGENGHTYGFYSIAEDLAGTFELPKFAAEATTKVDITPPVSHVSPLPATEVSPNFLVQWSGADPLSAVQGYTIYVSDSGGAFGPWLTQTAATQAWYPGFLGHTYGFFSQAVDAAGNVENLKTAAEASTQTLATSPEDVNGDGQINCADVDLVKASFGKKTGQPGFNAAADVNKDGVVNVLDLALVTQKVIPGTTCQ